MLFLIVEFVFCVNMSWFIGVFVSGCVVCRNIGVLSGIDDGLIVIECFGVSGMLSVLIGLFVLLCGVFFLVGMLWKNMKCGFVLSSVLMCVGFVFVYVLMFCIVVCVGVSLL